jgi:hypothetical protein
MSLVESKLSQLFMVLYQDNSIEIWNIEKFNRARHFKVDAAINDAFFSADNKFVFVAA